MSGVNKAIILGRLGRDPETRHVNNRPVCSFSVATDYVSRGERGDVKYTEWHTIECWDGTAEVCAKYLRKGREVYVEGRLQTDTWDDRVGEHVVKRSRTKIIALVVNFIGDPGKAGDK